MTALLPLGAQAQGRRKLTIVVGFPPGGAPDTVARPVVEGLRAQGYTAIVENKAGAGGRLAAESVRAAPADGATVKTVADFIAWAKANPGKAQFGSPGGGTAMHVLGVELGRAGKFEFNHIPYRGGAPTMSGLMGGQVPAIFTTLPLLIKSHQANKLRILGRSGEERSKAIPDVPTFKEAGFPGMTMSEMFVVVASAKTPEQVRSELATALAAAIASPSVKAAMEAAEFDSLALAPAGRRACNCCDSIHIPGLVNVDFDDVKTVLSEPRSRSRASHSACGAARVIDFCRRPV